MSVRTLPEDTIIKQAMESSRRLENDLRALLTYRDIVTGRGLEFDRVREYVPGDEAKMIDWNSLASTGKLYTKVFDEERLMNAVVAVDVSSSMTVGSSEVTKAEYASVVATTLARTSINAGDRAGLLAFSDDVKATIPASQGDETVLRFSRVLSDPELYGGEADWEGFSRHMRENFGADSYLFLVSDFIPLEQELLNLLENASNEFRGAMVVSLRDRLDDELPENVGKVYFTDPSSGEKVLVDADRVRNEYMERVAKKEQRLKNVARGSGEEYFNTHTDEDFADGFARYLDRRNT